MTSIKRTRSFFTVATVILLLSACANKPVDVFVAADGTVLTGELQTIQSGVAVFAGGGSAEVLESGRVWCLDGRTFAGEITASGGVIRSGSSSIPVDSIYLVVWGNTEIYQGVFAVDAALGWLDTGIELVKGEMLSLGSTGTVVTETGTSSPGGQEKFSSSTALVPGATSGQLVFRVGEGQPVAAGSSWIGESPDSGYLMLAVNVPQEGSFEPRGVYSVTVKAGTTGSLPGTVVFHPAGR